MMRSGALCVNGFWKYIIAYHCMYHTLMLCSARYAAGRFGEAALEMNTSPAEWPQEAALYFMIESDVSLMLGR
jgi:hypothetical protein